MRLTEITYGSSSLIVVDVQPTYEKSIKVVRGVAQLLNKHNGKKYVLYNSYDYGSGTYEEKSNVVNYLLEHGLDSKSLDNIEFKEKDYSLFMNWTHFPNWVIVRAIKAMFQHKVKKSSNLDIDTVFTKEEQKRVDVPDEFTEDCIYAPPVDFVNFLKRNSPLLICGGGKMNVYERLNLYAVRLTFSIE